MFLNNPASSRSILSNNENATTELHPKSNGTKKTSFVETPHRNKNELSKGGKTTQRRRRAFGDISNRKVTSGGEGGGGGGKDNTGVVLKRTSSSNNPIHGPSLKSTVKSITNRTSQVQFSTLPSDQRSTGALDNARGGVKSSANAKQKHRTSAEDDDVFSPTTRWANDDTSADDIRSPFHLVSDEEWNLVSNLRDEFSSFQKKKSEERIRLEIERDEQQFMEKIRAVNDIHPTDVDNLAGTFGGFNVSANKSNAAWNILDEKLPWEEEDETFDPTEDRRLSRTDPCSLWGDISSL